MMFGVFFALLVIPLMNGRYLLVDIKNGSETSRCPCPWPLPCGFCFALKTPKIPESVVEKEPEAKMCAWPPCDDQYDNYKFDDKNIEDGFINKPQPNPKSCVPLNGRCSLDKPNLTKLTMKLEFSFRSATKPAVGSCCEPLICFEGICGDFFQPKLDENANKKPKNKMCKPFGDGDCQD